MTHRRILLAAFVAATALSLAGCAGTTTGSADAGGTALTADQYQLALDYVGGEEGEADTSLDPIRIGFINVEGGAASYPEVTVGAQVAADLVNEHLGGVQGHPLEIVPCSIVEGDEDALKCAQQFANDPTIMGVQLGMTIFGTGPIFSTIGDKKPIIGFGPFGPQDVGAENAIFYAASTYAIAPGTIIQADELGAKTLAVVYEDNPGTQSQIALQAAVADEYGIEMTAVPVANASEWATALVSAGAQKADAVNVVASPSACVSAAQAVTQLGITAPVITTVLCLSPAVEEELGDWPAWSYVSPSTLTYGGGDDPQVEEFVAAMDSYSPGASLGGATPSTYGIVLSQVRAMNRIGVDALTPEALDAELRGFTGPVYLGPETLECGQYADKGAPSLCAAYAVTNTYLGDDEWTSVSIDTEGLGLGE
jgi:branched-chain amino acid transport system substrate-binding protein